MKGAKLCCRKAEQFRKRFGCCVLLAIDNRASEILFSATTSVALQISKPFLKCGYLLTVGKLCSLPEKKRQHLAFKDRVTILQSGFRLFKGARGCCCQRCGPIWV